jgi:DNA-binding NarL/FixJ family response regulator
VGLRDLLAKEGYQVVTAANSFEAMVKMKEDVSIGIFDLDLPAILTFALTGWDLVDIFRARHPNGTIIVVSTHEGNNVAARAKPWGIADCLVKPISPSRIKSLVKALKTQEINALDSAVGFLKVGVPAGTDMHGAGPSYGGAP